MKTERGDAHGIPSLFLQPLAAAAKNSPKQGECPSGEQKVVLQALERAGMTEKMPFDDCEEGGLSGMGNKAIAVCLGHLRTNAIYKMRQRIQEKMME